MAATVFAGLHFDAMHGLFTQNPLVLFGIAGIVILWRSRWQLGAYFVAIHLALVVPNALHWNWYGGYSFVGRFQVAAMICALVPAAIGFSAFAARYRFLAIAFAVAVGWWNIWNFWRVRNLSLILYNRATNTPVSEYGAWLPGPSRIQPVFYDSDWAWSHFPNQALLVVLAIGVVAFALSMRSRPAARLSLGVCDVTPTDGAPG